MNWLGTKMDGRENVGISRYQKGWIGSSSNMSKRVLETFNVASNAQAREAEDASPHDSRRLSPERWTQVRLWRRFNAVPQVIHWITTSTRSLRGFSGQSSNWNHPYFEDYATVHDSFLNNSRHSWSRSTFLNKEIGPLLRIEIRGWVNVYPDRECGNSNPSYPDFNEYGIKGNRYSQAEVK